LTLHRWIVGLFIIILLPGLVSCSAVQSYLQGEGPAQEPFQPVADAPLPVPASAVPEPELPIPAFPAPEDLPQAEIGEPPAGPSEEPVGNINEEEPPSAGGEAPLVEVLPLAPSAQAAAGGTIYIPQPGTPVGIPNFTNPSLGCLWMGVGGQIFNQAGVPQQNLLVELGGALGGQTLSALTLTGSATMWGPGGYEFKLADGPQASQGTLWIQVHNLQGETLTGRLPFDTYSECERNAILFNLAEVQVSQSFLPFIYREAGQ
jgi:hypothetical protein